MGDGFEDDRGQIVGVLADSRCRGIGVVERRDDRLLDGLGEHPVGLGVALADLLRWWVHRDVDVVVPTVVAALELQHFPVVRVGAGESDGVVGGLRAAVAEVDLFDAGEVVDQCLRDVDFEWRRAGAEQHARIERLANGLVHPVVAVAENHRPETEVVVGEALAVDGVERGPVGGVERDVAEVVRLRSQPSLGAAGNHVTGPFDDVGGGVLRHRLTPPRLFGPPSAHCR